jgi:hypothetical protein
MLALLSNHLCAYGARHLSHRRVTRPSYASYLVTVIGVGKAGNYALALSVLSSVACGSAWSDDGMNVDTQPFSSSSAKAFSKHLSQSIVTFIIPVRTLALLMILKMAPPRHKCKSASENSFSQATSNYFQPKKTYNSRYSLVVTDPTTNPPIASLTMGERTGSRIF